MQNNLVNAHNWIKMFTCTFEKNLKTNKQIFFPRSIISSFQ